MMFLNAGFLLIFTANNVSDGIMQPTGYTFRDHCCSSVCKSM